MKLFLLLFFSNTLILLSSASKTYFVVLKKPLNLAEGSGYQLMNGDAQTSVSALANVTSASIQENLKNQVFSLEGVKGMKFFHQFKNSSTVNTQNQNAISPTQQSTQNILSGGYVYLIQIDAEAVDQFKESLKELDDFIHFQPNYRYKTFTTPNTEPLYFRQETEMDLMEFESDEGPNSWVEASGIGARVAVLDTGIYPEHQDFCGDNGTFDETAQIMDVSACDALDAPYDFVENGTPTIADQLDGITAVTGADYEDKDAAPYDKNGHGTHVSGIIGARVNGDGIGGAAYESTILPIRVLAPYYDNGSLTGIGNTNWIVNGINYAVTNNADVINMSLGGIFDAEDDLIMISAINAAYNAGVLIIAAAGNESSDFDNTKVAPAYYSNVMSVSSVNNTGQFASSYSNFGESLDVAAVGTYVYNAGINSPVSYVSQTGTSMATPYVSALAALIVSRNNLNGSEALSPDDIRSIIKDTASNATDPTNQLGYGIINASAALALIDNFDPTDAYTYPSIYSNKVLCYPNPLYRNQSNFTDCSIIQNQTGSAEYSVYSRRGQQVASGGLTISSTKSTFSWNGTDLNGERLPNGVYQLVLTLTPSDGTSSAITYKHLVTLL